MTSIQLRDILPDQNGVDAYIKYRIIEDWCHDNVPKGRWRFDYSHTICVCGIDIPGRIFFWADEDAVTFRLTFSS